MDGQTTQNLGKAMWTDTKKLAVWKEDISAAIWNDWSKILDKNQIPINLDKREKEVAKKRFSES